MLPSKQVIAFVTMVRDDREMLTKWIAHHETLTGDRKLIYVIAHGGDPEILKIAQGCSCISIPFDETGTDFEAKRINLLRRFADGLLGYFEHICILDCDEFIIVNPLLNKTLAEVLAQDVADGPAISPLGFEVVQRPELENEPFDFSTPVLSQRKHGFFNTIYSKPCILKAPGLRGSIHHLKNAPWQITHHLFLVHLKWMDLDFLAQTSQKRAKVMATFDIDTENLGHNGWDERTGIGGWHDVDVGFAEYQAMFPQGVSDFPMGDALEWFPRRFERVLKRRGRVPKIVFGPFKIPVAFENSL